MKPYCVEKFTSSCERRWVVRDRTSPNNWWNAVRHLLLKQEPRQTWIDDSGQFAGIREDVSDERLCESFVTTFGRVISSYEAVRVRNGMVSFWLKSIGRPSERSQWQEMKPYARVTLGLGSKSGLIFVEEWGMGSFYSSKLLRLLE